MSKFCGKCGSPLQENELCNCQASQQVSSQQAAVQQTPVQQASVQEESAQQETPKQDTVNEKSQQFNSEQLKQEGTKLFKKAFQTFKELLKTPNTVGKELIQKADMKMAIVFIILQGIFSGLFALVVCGKISSYIESFMNMTGALSSDFGSVMGLTSMLKMPYGKIFIITIIASIALSCLLAGLLWQGHKIIKNQVTYNQMLSAVAIKSALVLPCILASIIVFQLKAGFGIFLFVALTIWGFTAMIIAMASNLNDTAKDKFVLMISIVLLLFVIITLFVVSKLWPEYLPDIFRTALSGVKSFLDNPGKLIEEMISSMF